MNEFVPIVREQSCIGGVKPVSYNATDAATAITQFNALTGTALARLRHKDKWFDYEQAMVQGVSVRKAAISCGVAMNTSFKWRHRFLRTPALH